MAGLLFAKMTNAKNGNRTFVFSKDALIGQRDGDLCFMFRIGNVCKTNIIGAKIKAYFIRTKTTKEGEIIRYYHTEIDIQIDSCMTSEVFFIW